MVFSTGGGASWHRWHRHLYMRGENAARGYLARQQRGLLQRGLLQIPDLGAIACATHAACAGSGGRDPRPGTFPSPSFLSLGPPPLFQGGAQLLHYGHAVPHANPLGNAGLGLAVGRFIGCLRTEGIRSRTACRPWSSLSLQRPTHRSCPQETEFPGPSACAGPPPP